MDERIRGLLRWYRGHARKLPWRNTRDPYRIFVSELMLQQTQVDRVIPKYREWLRLFPSWSSLAKARSADLIRAWAGLGYNRRVLYAHEAARSVRTHGVPTTEAEWRRLKGVGPYMAAALATFVNNARTVVIDTNVRRVAGRLLLGIPFPRPTDDQNIRRRLLRILPTHGPYRDIPQAFMDLASAVCLARTPKCDACPLAYSCRARAAFSVGRIEQTKKEARKQKRTERIHGDKPHPDRIYRGKILAWVRTHGPTRLRIIGSHIDPSYDPIADADWLRAMTFRLAKDGLILIRPGDILVLPNS